MNQLRYYLYFLLGRLRRLYFMQLPENKAQLKKSRTWFIIDACTAVTIQNLSGGAFLASLLKELSISDALNGIISSVISLGALAQVLGAALTKRMRKIKLFVCLLALIHRVLFSLIFFIPFWPLPVQTKILLFAFIYTGAHLIGNTINPSAANWLGSIVPARFRGRYMARRDLLAVLCTMIVTLLYSFILDQYKAIGSTDTGFQIGGLLVLSLALMNFISLTSVKEPRISALNRSNLEMHGTLLRRFEKEEKKPKESFLFVLSTCFSDKGFRKVLFVTISWHAFYYFSFPYFGIYQVKELGLSYTYIMGVGFVANALRIFITPFIGKYADRHSWSKTMRNGFALFGLAFLINAFAVPQNGKIVFFIFTILFSIAAPGVNLGIFNLQFENTHGEDKTPYIGLNSALAGAIGFLFAIFGGMLLDQTVVRNNQIFGIFLYGQQILSFLSAVGVLLLAVAVERKLVRNG